MIVQTGTVPASQETLRARYEAYCAEQAAALPSLVPREGLRALYRSARAGVSGEVVDPLALLVARCRELLPLPPFEVWVADYLRDRCPYLEAMDGGTAGSVRSTPVTVDLRRVDLAGQPWIASLALFREPPEWRGFITFHPEDGNLGSSTLPADAPHPRVRRTADVFVETQADDVRRRFRAFSPDTLQAFLRSTLP